MMDQGLLQSYDVDIEEGELSESSDEVYTPLARPNTLTITATTSSPTTTTASCGVIAAVNGTVSPFVSCDRMEQPLEEQDEESQTESSESSSGESSDNCLKKLAADGASDTERKKRKRVRRTVMVRVTPTEQAKPEDKRGARFKKYNVWTEALQEEALTENMRGCDVTRSSCNDRNVENYDYSLHHRLNGKNSLKRRLSNSADDWSDNEMLPVAKRGRRNSRPAGKNRDKLRNRDGSSPTSGSDNSYEPRHIVDLSGTAGREPLDVAREIANKLCEEKDELLVRIVEVLGTELPVEVYKETQRIEADGGMMIKNGKRRRTPGGVFLFLLKHHDRITPEEVKAIFTEERQNDNKWRKEIKSKSRDRKVEELKKRLSEQERDLPALSTRKEHFLLGSDLSVESQSGNLSNPPPSPVGQDQSPDYKSHAINHEKATASAAAASTVGAADLQAKDLISYDDDFLDVNCGEMDMF